MMSVVRELPPRASCSNRVSFESRYGTCDDELGEEEEEEGVAVLADDPEDDDDEDEDDDTTEAEEAEAEADEAEAEAEPEAEAEAEEAVEDISAAVSAETTLPSAESDLLMPHASSNLYPLAPDLDTFSQPARSTRYNFECVTAATAPSSSEEEKVSRQSATMR